MQYDTKRSTHQANTFVTYDMLGKAQCKKTTEIIDYMIEKYQEQEIKSDEGNVVNNSQND